MNAASFAAAGRAGTSLAVVMPMLVGRVMQNPLQRPDNPGQGRLGETNELQLIRFRKPVKTALVAGSGRNRQGQAFASPCQHRGGIPVDGVAPLLPAVGSYFLRGLFPELRGNESFWSDWLFCSVWRTSLPTMRSVLPTCALL